ncbi:hypothetical protein LEP1GSC047_2489 [Leptospira inadai serovar Lyme str. 10]|uniref:Uncharacterized protein n=2 Tax=Leptospira inadai serovar Lyme TaxID=293084 RepID=V6HEP1_9LEPT|nr:hypothetical protein [Leptospira inadai]EQA38597.1 hypothetical protein LEP1GSC047_2489 [Leptospira inadai serovar Lyme str. 10]PNV75176.1 hypothetical protein BES34_009835 [Leptospira inadai serovar Lyme]
MQFAVVNTRERIGKRFKIFQGAILSVLLYSLAMDAVIDTIDIWNGDWSGISREFLILKNPRYNIHEREGLYTGSYFESQTKEESGDEPLPLLGFQLIEPNSDSFFMDISGGLTVFPLLLYFFLSLPPPTIF